MLTGIGVVAPSFSAGFPGLWLPSQSRAVWKNKAAIFQAQSISIKIVVQRIGIQVPFHQRIVAAGGEVRGCKLARRRS
jgi:hypothetical protein